MDSEQKTAEIEKIIKEAVEMILAKMGMKGSVEIKNSQEDGAFVCDIKSEESNFLIGQYGVNLQALQHLSRVIARKKTNEKINFILDVNAYRQEKNESVIKLAQNFATQCINERRAIVLRPMSPYERRIVHMELSKNEQVATESIGEGEGRRIVIKPIDLI